MKLFTCAIAALMFIAYLAPIAYKLREISLGLVILIGTGLAALSLWESISNRNH
jgi:hypothetical protein